MAMEQDTKEILQLSGCMATIHTGVMVKRPDGEAQPAQVGPHGGVSVGPSHLPGIGPVMHVAIHHGDGQTQIATLGAQAFAQFGALINESARRIMSGEFDHPERVN